MSQLPQDITDKIRDLRQAGLSQEVVMERLSVSRGAVLKYQPREVRAGEWTDADLETLTVLWKGGSTATEIARRLPGRSRSAVLGKISRLGLKRDVALNIINQKANGARQAKITNSRIRPEKALKPKVERPTQPAKIVAVAPPPPPPLEPAVEPLVTMKPEFFKPQQARPFMDRSMGQCAWPLTIGGELMACCDPVSPKSGGRQWCAHHTRQGQVSASTHSKRKARAGVDIRTGALRQWA
jgi:GcrA cell cycle regulator